MNMGEVRGAQLCKSSKAGAASNMMMTAKLGQPPVFESPGAKNDRGHKKTLREAVNRLLNALDQVGRQCTCPAAAVAAAVGAAVAAAEAALAAAAPYLLVAAA
jgi:hypothetical protein